VHRRLGAIDPNLVVVDVHVPPGGTDAAVAEQPRDLMSGLGGEGCHAAKCARTYSWVRRVNAWVAAV
jgi:hypothetical protein